MPDLGRQVQRIRAHGLNLGTLMENLKAAGAEEEVSEWLLPPAALATRRTTRLQGGLAEKKRVKNSVQNKLSVWCSG